MSIKLSCDYPKKFSSSIYLSPRRDVARKRLRSQEQQQQQDQQDTNLTLIPTTTRMQSTELNRLNWSSSELTSDLQQQQQQHHNAIAVATEDCNHMKLMDDCSKKRRRHQQQLAQQQQLWHSRNNSNSNNNNNNNYNSNSNNNNNNFLNKLLKKFNKLIKLYLYHIILLIIIQNLIKFQTVNGLLINPMQLSSSSSAAAAAIDDDDDDDSGGGGGSSNIGIISSITNSELNGGLSGLGGILQQQQQQQQQGSGSSSANLNGNVYRDKLDNLERSVAAVLIKVAYGTTSTTKRSIPDNSYIPSLTTIATPPLTTLRYNEKSPHQQQINLHHRNYELDLERDHALPTSAPNADILKSNSNPTYPNPNRHHNHDRDRHRHILNSTPVPAIHNIPKKGQPTIPMYPGDMPSYSPPARAFFTPPLPPEYHQNPFADKPTLRGTNNEGGMGLINSNIAAQAGQTLNGGGGGGAATAGGNSYINRRPIPPPSLMPGHERIPFRPPDLQHQPAAQMPTSNLNSNNINSNDGSSGISVSSVVGGNSRTVEEPQRKKVLNTPSVNIKLDNDGGDETGRRSGSTSTGVHIPNLTRILSGPHGSHNPIADVLLKQVTNHPANPGLIESETIPVVNQRDKNSDGGGSNDDDDDEEDDYDIFAPQSKDEPKTQLTVKMSSGGAAAAAAAGTLSTENTIYSTQIIHNLANEKLTSTTLSTPGHTAAAAAGNPPAAKETIGGKSGTTNSATNSNISSSNSGAAATWDIAWNIHVYLSVILFTILGVYSIFKMICYDKLTHLFNESYFISIHLILIGICCARIFFLIYDAYNRHGTFSLLIGELFLNLPATFLTVAFSCLILFLLIRSLNHKNNRYSALIRPLTVVVGCSVHVGLCITLHYVESYTIQQQMQSYLSLNHRLKQPVLPPPRVLSLICQIIYIFVCLSLGVLYLYLYRILKRVLRNKSQNYIHGYQNLSYAIHITIATALLFILLAALQIFGAISISTTRSFGNLDKAGGGGGGGGGGAGAGGAEEGKMGSEIDWLHWGYQFSLRLIEIAIIWLLSWVAGLKTGGGGGGSGSGNSAAVREKSMGHDQHNVSGFALFPCTSSSSQEHFETDYPAVCNANTNLHTYTLRTGKPIYDDNFALNSLQNGGSAAATAAAAQEYPTRSFETNSMRSCGDANSIQHSDYHGAEPDHYENPNFELRTKLEANCYSEPLNPMQQQQQRGSYEQQGSNFDFQNFERPHFQTTAAAAAAAAAGGGLLASQQQPPTDMLRPSSRQKLKNFDRAVGQYENPERRSSNSIQRPYHHHHHHYNSFDRRNGIRKSGTLNNIGGGGGGNIIHNRNGGAANSSSSSSSSVGSSNNHNHHHHHHHQQYGGGGGGAQTLSSAGHYNHRGFNKSNGGGGGGGKQHFYRSSTTTAGGQRSSLDRNEIISSEPIHQPAPPSSLLLQQQQHYMLPSDDEILVSSHAERTNLINNCNNTSSSGGDGSCGLATSTSGSNLTDLTSAAAAPAAAAAAILNDCNGGGGICQQANGNSGAGSCTSGDSTNSGSMLVAEHGFVRFRALDDINNAQGVGIHNASIRTAGGGGANGVGSGGGVIGLGAAAGRINKDKQRCYTNNS